MPNRRQFITGLTTLLAAPALVRAASLDYVPRLYVREPYDRFVYYDLAGPELTYVVRIERVRDQLPVITDVERIREETPPHVICHLDGPVRIEPALLRELEARWDKSPHH